MLTSPFGWNVYNGSFQQFEKCLLNTFTRNIACNGRIVTFSSNFIQFINKHYSELGFFHIVIGSL